VILYEEDFMDSISKINCLYEDYEPSGNTISVRDYFIVELVGLIRSGGSADVFDLLDALSNTLLRTTDMIQDRLQEARGNKAATRFSSSELVRLAIDRQGNHRFFEYLCIEKIAAIPKMQILFDFGILNLTTGIVLVSSEGKEIIKYIKAKIAKEAYLSSKRNLS
jgi:hypothetical protein